MQRKILNSVKKHLLIINGQRIRVGNNNIIILQINYYVILLIILSRCRDDLL